MRSFFSSVWLTVINTKQYFSKYPENFNIYFVIDDGIIRIIIPNTRQLTCRLYSQMSIVK